jgi:hypothetical protein
MGMVCQDAESRNDDRRGGVVFKGATAQSKRGGGKIAGRGRRDMFKTPVGRPGCVWPACFGEAVSRTINSLSASCDKGAHVPECRSYLIACSRPRQNAQDLCVAGGPAAGIPAGIPQGWRGHFGSAKTIYPPHVLCALCFPARVACLLRFSVLSVGGDAVLAA